MLNKIIVNSLGLFKSIMFNPARVFQNMGKGKYDLTVYFLFLVSGLITFFKSFSIKKHNINFFLNESINEILSFFSIPQIKWLITFLSFILFVFLIRVFCQLLLKGCNKKELMVCFLSISSAGILLQILFYILQYFLSQKSVYVLSYIAFVWIVYLSIIAIKNSQNASYMKSVIIYIFSGLPVILIIGLTGLAPFLLWVVVSPVLRY
jgi:hypothetical protein